MKNTIFTLITFLACLQIGLSQNSSLTGDWMLAEVEIDLQTNDETALTTENFLWRDLYKDDLPLKFTQDGQLIFQKDDLLTVATYQVDGTAVYLHLTNDRGVRSSTRYEFQKSGTELVLSRQDPLVNERYLFKLAQ